LDFYIVLEVVREASNDEIKKAFRRLARRYHPDINPGDRRAEERFKLISDAYDVLGDPTKREFYDRNGFYTEGAIESQDDAAAWGFEFKTFDAPHVGAAAEMFSQFQQRRTVRRGPERGQDLEYQISIGFPESIFGLKTRISMQRRLACTGCSGTGKAAVPRNAACTGCGGSGQQVHLRGRLQFVAPCEQCAGTGRSVTQCPDCGGEGRGLVTDIVDVEIPAGVASGSRIRYAGMGDVGRLGGPSGDLYVITNVAPHSYFVRVGDNIQCVLPVSFVEAALGAKVEVPTVDGPATVRIPPGTQNGQVLRLRGKGAPSLLQPGTRGDALLEIRVMVPRIGDERSKEILREFAQLNAEDPRKDAWKG